MSNPKITSENSIPEPVPSITLSNLTAFVSNLEGKILTIVDASISNPTQLRAMKSLVRQAVWEKYDIVKDWYYNNKIENNASSFPFREAVDYDQDSLPLN